MAEVFVQPVHDNACVAHGINGPAAMAEVLSFGVYKDLGVEDVIVRPTNEYRPAFGHPC
jgi:hypothetical protein